MPKTLAADIKIRAKEIGVTATLTGNTGAAIGQMMATEDLAAAIREGLVGNRQLVEQLLAAMKVAPA